MPISAWVIGEAYRVGADGKLSFVRKYVVETGGKIQFWSDIVGCGPERRRPGDAVTK